MQANLTFHTPTVESISELVHAFYADVRQDALVTIPRQSRGHSGCEPLKAAVRGR